MTDPRFTSNVNRQVGAGGSLLTYPSNLGNELAAQQHYMIIDAYPNSLSTGYKSDSNADLSVALYIPPGGLKTAYGAKYETFEGYRSVVNGVRDQIIRDQAASQRGGVGAAGPGGRSDPVTDALAVVKQAATGAATYADPQTAAFLTAKAVKEKSDIGRASMIGAGVAVNPYLSVFFAGPGDFRTHTFSFDFLPQTADESNTVRQIITGLKYRMLPGKMSNADHSYFLSFPHQFRINFYPNGKYSQMKDLFQIDRCVLTNMSVDYGGQGVPVFFDKTGQPYNIKVDLSFQDTKLITREDVKTSSGLEPSATPL